MMAADSLQPVTEPALLREGTHRSIRLAPAIDEPAKRLPTFRNGPAPLPARAFGLHWPAVELAMLNEAMVTGRGAVIDGEGRLLLHSVSDQIDSIHATPQSYSDVLAQCRLAVTPEGLLHHGWGRVEPAFHVREPVFHLLNARDQNYTHFMFELLPKLAFYLDMPAPRPRLLVSEAVHATFSQLLVVLGVRREDLVAVPAQGWIRVDRIFVATSPSWLHRPVMQGVRRALDAEQGPARCVAGNRLYIRRTGMKAWARNLLNEQEVYAQLEGRGFRAMQPDGLSASEQVALFRSAEVVAGLYGGGLLNCVVSAPGTRVLSLTSTAYWRTGLDTAAPVLDLQAAQVVGDCFLARQDPNNSAFLIDIRALNAACDMLDL
jgi:capsular polysaccharide biosynthesis protein